MEIKPIEQIETQVDMKTVNDILEFFETLITTEEETTEDYPELNFND